MLCHGFPPASPAPAPRRGPSRSWPTASPSTWGWMVLSFNFRGRASPRVDFSLAGGSDDVHAAIDHLHTVDRVRQRDAGWPASAPGERCASAPAPPDPRCEGVAALAAPRPTSTTGPTTPAVILRSTPARPRPDHPIGLPAVPGRVEPRVLRPSARSTRSPSSLDRPLLLRARVGGRAVPHFDARVLGDAHGRRRAADHRRGRPPAPPRPPGDRHPPRLARPSEAPGLRRRVTGSVRGRRRGRGRRPGGHELRGGSGVGDRLRS